MNMENILTALGEKLNEKDKEIAWLKSQLPSNNYPNANTHCVNHDNFHISEMVMSHWNRSPEERWEAVCDVQMAAKCSLISAIEYCEELMQDQFMPGRFGGTLGAACDWMKYGGRVAWLKGDYDTAIWGVWSHMAQPIKNCRGFCEHMMSVNTNNFGWGEPKIY